MKKSDLHKLIKESMPGYPEDRFAATAGDTKWAKTGPDAEQETSGSYKVTGSNQQDVEHWSTAPRANEGKKKGGKKKGGKMSDGQYSRLSDKLGLEVQAIETEMKSVLKDWKAAEGDAKKPFVEKLKELTADKKDKEKEMDELDAKFDAQAPPEMEVDKSAMDEGKSDDFPNLKKWWTEDPKKVITFIYWLRKQTPPAAGDRDKIWKTMAKFLNKKHPAPEEVYQKIISEGFSDEDRRSKETVELDHRDTSYLNEYNSAIYEAFSKLGRAESAYFGRGDYEVELELIPTHEHRGFPDSFLYKPRNSPSLTGQMEFIRFDRVDGNTYKAKGKLRERNYDIEIEPLNEELTRIDKSDIKKLIQKEIETSLKSKNFKDKVSDAVTKDVKKNPELEKMVVEITRNVITQLYKVLWMRRTFWRNSLKNTPA